MGRFTDGITPKGSGVRITHADIELMRTYEDLFPGAKPASLHDFLFHGLKMAVEQKQQQAQAPATALALDDVNKRIEQALAAQKEELLKQFEAEKAALQKEFSKLINVSENPYLKEVSNSTAIRLKMLWDATENTFPVLFPVDLEDKERLELTFEEMLLLLIDYAERDPSNEFPFEPLAQKIVNRYKMEKEHGGEHESGAGAAEAGSAEG